MSIIYNGKEFKVKKKSDGLTLELSGKGIADISQIEGLGTLTDLNILILNSNMITEIKGLESLKNLKKLDLSGNQIIEIKGLDTLLDLEELSLEKNTIESIKGLDALRNLHTLNLFGNRITKVESFQNKEKLNWFLFGGNPLYNQVRYAFGLTNYQNLMKYIQMSPKKRKIAMEKGKEVEQLRRERLESEKQKQKAKNITNMIMIPIIFFGVIFFIISFIIILTLSLY